FLQVVGDLARDRLARLAHQRALVPPLAQALERQGDQHAGRDRPELNQEILPGMGRPVRRMELPGCSSSAIVYARSPMRPPGSWRSRSKRSYFSRFIRA